MKLAFNEVTAREGGTSSALIHSPQPAGQAEMEGCVEGWMDGWRDGQMGEGRMVACSPALTNAVSGALCVCVCVCVRELRVRRPVGRRAIFLLGGLVPAG